MLSLQTREATALTLASDTGYRTLYHCVGARSFRPLWALEELGLPYSLVVLPFPPRVLAREFKTLNPLGTIPLYVEGALRMTESAAIVQYLADTQSGNASNTLAVSRDAEAYGDYLNALHFGEATLTFPQTLVLRYGKLEPEARRIPQVVQDYGDWFIARLKPMEARLATQTYVCAGRFTAADISVAYALHLANQLGLDARFGPAVRAYYALMAARPAFQAALQAERRGALAAGLDPAPPATQ